MYRIYVLANGRWQLNSTTDLAWMAAQMSTLPDVLVIVGL